jgi:drug/metabolite transporter (DMT)-like permease
MRSVCPGRDPAPVDVGVLRRSRNLSCSSSVLVVLSGLLAALGTALCYGVSSVLQAQASRAAAPVEGLDIRLLARLLGSWRYVVGVGLDLVGFVLALSAVRSLPLFVVQSVVAGFLAVTAVLGAVVLAMPLTRADRVGLGVVVAGLVLLGSSAAEDASDPVADAVPWGLLAVVVLLGLVAVPLARVPGARGGSALGALAGLEFGATAVAARILPGDLSVNHLGSEVGILLASPATYALVLAGIVAMLAYSIALQRGTVTQATAPLVVGETIAPALVGILLLGDRPRAGWEWVAVLGFVFAVGGALSLAGHGEVRTPE